MGQAELPHRFTVEGGELKRLFEKSRFAISTEETRYYLNGIYCTASKAAPRPSSGLWPPTATGWRKSRPKPRAAPKACPA